METPVAFVVLKPGIEVEDIDMSNVQPTVTLLDWKFANKENETLIDLIPQIDAKVKAMAKWIEGAKEILRSRLVHPEHVGDVSITRAFSYEAHISKRARIDLDRDLVKTEMGEQWYAEHCKSTEYEELRFKPIAGTGG